MDKTLHGLEHFTQATSPLLSPDRQDGHATTGQSGPNPNDSAPQPILSRPADRFPTVTLEQLAHTPMEPQQYLVQPFLPASEATAIYGPPKSLKSFLVMEMALSVTTGRHFLGQFAVQQGPVLYVDLENRLDRLRERIRAALARDGLSDSDTGGRFNLYQHHKGVAPWRLDRNGLTALRDAIGRHKPVLVVVDNLRKALPPGTDENSNKEVNPILNELLSACEQYNAALLLVHHTNKGREVYSGAGCFESTMANTIAVSRDNGTLVATVRAGVTRNAEDFAPFTVMLGSEGALQPATPNDGQSKPSTSTSRGSILDALQRGGKTVADLMEATRLTDRQVRYQLNDLTASGAVIELGPRSGAADRRGAAPRQYGLPAREDQQA